MRCFKPYKIGFCSCALRGRTCDLYFLRSGSSAPMPSMNSLRKSSSICFSSSSDSCGSSSPPLPPAAALQLSRGAGAALDAGGWRLPTSFRSQRAMGLEWHPCPVKTRTATFLSAFDDGWKTTESWIVPRQTPSSAYKKWRGVSVCGPLKGDRHWDGSALAMPLPLVLHGNPRR